MPFLTSKIVESTDMIDIDAVAVEVDEEGSVVDGATLARTVSTTGVMVEEVQWWTRAVKTILSVTSWVGLSVTTSRSSKRLMTGRALEWRLCDVPFKLFVQTASNPSAS